MARFLLEGTVVITDLFGDRSPRAAASVGAVIYPVLAVQSLQQNNALFWGSKDSSGTVQNVTESLHWTSDPSKAVRFLYDSQGRLAQSINQDTGQFLTYRWDVADQCTLHFYDSGANLLGGAVVQMNGTAATVGPIPMSQAAHSPTSLPTRLLAPATPHFSSSRSLQNIGASVTPSPQNQQVLHAVADILIGTTAGSGLVFSLQGLGVVLSEFAIASIVFTGGALGALVGLILPLIASVIATGVSSGLTDANPFGNSPAYAYQQYSPGPNGYHISNRNNSIWAGNYSGTYSGAESGAWGGTVDTNGILAATAATSSGPFIGSSNIGGAGQTSIGFSGSGAAGQFTITFTGTFAYAGAGSIQGNGSWGSSSGEAGTWQGQGSGSIALG